MVSAAQRHAKSAVDHNKSGENFQSPTRSTGCRQPKAASEEAGTDQLNVGIAANPDEPDLRAHNIQRYHR